jgi:hypothetical protein
MSSRIAVSDGHQDAVCRPRVIAHSFLTLVCRHTGRQASPERLALDFEG